MKAGRTMRAGDAGGGGGGNNGRDGMTCEVNGRTEDSGGVGSGVVGKGGAPTSSVLKTFTTLLQVLAWFYEIRVGYKEINRKKS